MSDREQAMHARTEHGSAERARVVDTQSHPTEGRYVGWSRASAWEDIDARLNSLERENECLKRQVAYLAKLANAAVHEELDAAMARASAVLMPADHPEFMARMAQR